MGVFRLDGFAGCRVRELAWVALTRELKMEYLIVEDGSMDGRRCHWQSGIFFFNSNTVIEATRE